MDNPVPVVEWTHVHTADCIKTPVDSSANLDFVVKAKSLLSSSARWRFHSASVDCLKWNYLVQEDDLLSFIEWNGQLCMSKKIDFVVDVTLPFVKRWIKF